MPLRIATLLEGDKFSTLGSFGGGLLIVFHSFVVEPASHSHADSASGPGASRREFLLKAVLGSAHSLSSGLLQGIWTRGFDAALGTVPSGEAGDLSVHGGRAPATRDLFDPKKPRLNELAGSQLPPEFSRPITAMWARWGLVAGQSPNVEASRGPGWVSDWLSHTATCADDLVWIRSCWGTASTTRRASAR